MFHKDEAERVIAISLGKIASYKNQRGGSSLHKNLLVTNVLHKVRTYVSEDQTFVWENPLERICMPESSHLAAADDFSVVPNDSDNQKLNLKPNEESPILFCKSGQVECSTAVIGSFETRDAVNGCDFAGVPISEYAAECEISDSYEEISYTQLKSSGEYDSDAECYSGEGSKSRCLKRRQDVFNDQDSMYAKRRKYDGSEYLVNDTSWRLQPTLSDTDSESESDCIDAEPESSVSTPGDNSMDTEQICSLVSVFKCSFHGLGLIDNSDIGTCEEAVSSTDYGYPNSHLYVQELSSTSNRDGKPNALRRGLSLPDLCAKQADLMCQTFQLAAPVLALTV